MDRGALIRLSEYEWQIPARGKMHVPAVFFADETLMTAMDDKIFEQAGNVASRRPASFPQVASLISPVSCARYSPA